MYNDLTEFERALARFGDKVALIAGLEISDKISPEEAYQQIKIFIKNLKLFVNLKRNLGNLIFILICDGRYSKNHSK
jgi:hypothetical protein